MVKRNVVFNDTNMTTDAMAVIPGDLSVGEKKKIIQLPETNSSCTEEDATENPANEPNPDNISSNSAPDSEEHNSVPFPSPPGAFDAMLWNPIEEPDIELTLVRDGDFGVNRYGRWG